MCGEPVAEKEQRQDRSEIEHICQWYMGEGTDVGERLGLADEGWDDFWRTLKQKIRRRRKRPNGGMAPHDYIFASLKDNPIKNGEILSVGAIEMLCTQSFINPGNIRDIDKFKRNLFTMLPARVHIHFVEIFHLLQYC